MPEELDKSPRGGNLDHGWDGGFDDDRLDTPTFHRNHAPIAKVLQKHISSSTTGAALEVGSGSGQHVIGFAGAFPKLHWSPSDPDPRHRASIEAWRAASGTDNVDTPLNIDLLQTPWLLNTTAPLQAIVCINVLHIAPWGVTEGLISGAGHHLARGASLFVYGPFMLGGVHTAQSNDAFDASLRARNPEWGIRDLDDIKVVADTHGLEMIEIATMPANNFTLILRRHS